MKASTTMMTVCGLVVAGLALGAVADRAEAQYFFAPAPVVYSAPVYVAPAPVYYPQPVYYSAPVYVAPQPVGYYPRSFGFSFGYASYGRHHHCHRGGRGFGFGFGYRH